MEVVDIINPENLKELIDMLKELKRYGFTSIVVIGLKKDDIEKARKEIKENIGLKIYLAEETKKRLRKTIPVWPPERKFFEYRHAGLIKGVELIHNKDHTHYKRSGLNEVLAKLAKENHKVIISPIWELKKARTIKEKAVILGRMMQNAMLSNKYGFIYAMASLARNKKELIQPENLKAIGRAIGLHPSNAKKSVEWIKEIVD